MMTLDVDDYPSYEMGPPSAPPNISGLNFAAIVRAMVKWFFDNFEDAAESTPFESVEGGYQYIWGGPYDAGEELNEAFETQLEGMSEEIKEKLFGTAVSVIEEDGYEWAPSDRRIREEKKA